MQDPAVDVNTDMVQRVSAHHTVIFNRKKLGLGLSDRTFLNSLIAKKVAEEPPTYMLVVVSIPSHPKITAKDEAGAVRAENFRSFYFTEVAPGRTKIDYVCSLDLRGRCPQTLTNLVAIPQQVVPPKRPIRPRLIVLGRFVSR